MRYALLAYSNSDVRDQRTDDEQRRITAGIAEVLARPHVTGWLRLHDTDSATTVPVGYYPYAYSNPYGYQAPNYWYGR